MIRMRKHMHKQCRMFVIIIIDNFCIALFSGVHKLSCCALQHSLTFSTLSERKKRQTEGSMCNGNHLNSKYLLFGLISSDLEECEILNFRDKISEN